MRYISLFLSFFMAISSISAQSKITPDILWKLGRISSVQITDVNTKIYDGLQLSQAMRDYLAKDRLGRIGTSCGGYSTFMFAGIHENSLKMH